MVELEKADRGETDGVTLSELLSGRHSKGRFYATLVRMHLVVYKIFHISKKRLCSLIPFAVVFIGSTLYALQQLSGINAVFYFSSTVFRSVGVPANLTNVFIGISNLAGVVQRWLAFMYLLFHCIGSHREKSSGSFIAMTLMDKVGRKLLLLWSFLGMVISIECFIYRCSSSYGPTPIPLSKKPLIFIKAW